MSTIPKVPPSLVGPESYRQLAETLNQVIDVVQPFHVSPVKASTFTVGETYGIYPSDASATAMSAMLPPAAAHKSKVYRIVRIKGATAVIADADATESIDGSITAAVNTKLTVFSDGSAWYSV